jgi:hypothetical protein
MYRLKKDEHGKFGGGKGWVGSMSVMG